MPLPLAPGSARWLAGCALGEPFTRARVALQLAIDPFLAYWLLQYFRAQPEVTTIDLLSQQWLKSTGNPARTWSAACTFAAGAESHRHNAYNQRAVYRCVRATLRQSARECGHFVQYIRSPRVVHVVKAHVERYLRDGECGASGGCELTGSPGELANLPTPQPFVTWLLRKARRSWRRQRTMPATHWSGVLAMSGRLAALEEKFTEHVQAARLEGLREFVYGASHEINNPLNNIATRAQLLLRTPHTEEVHRHLVGIREQSLRAFDMLADLSLIAKPPTPKPERLSAITCLEQAAKAARVLARDRNQQVCVHVEVKDPSATVYADPIQLRVALDELCRNALEAMPDGGLLRLECETEHAPCETQRQVLIRVRDQGKGIEPAMQSRIFDPFFSGRDAGRGLGFGLCKAWVIIRQNGGMLYLESATPGDTSFALRLPAISSYPSPSGPEVDPRLSPHNAPDPWEHACTQGNHVHG